MPPKYPAWLDNLAYEVWERYKCSKFTHDSRGRCNPIVVYAFFRTLYNYAVRQDVSDIKTTLEELVDHIDPDLERGENLRILMQLIPKSGLDLDEAMRWYEASLAYEQQLEEEMYRELAEEWGGLMPDTLSRREYRELLEKTRRRVREIRQRPETRQEELKKWMKVGIERYLTTPSRVEYVRIEAYRPITKSEAWRIFCDKLREKEINCEVYRSDFDRLWNEVGMISRDEFIRRIDELVRFAEENVSLFESMEPEQRISMAKALGITPTLEEMEKEIIAAIKQGRLTKEQLREYAEKAGTYSACGRLFSEGLISYREYRYCMSVELG